MNFTSIYIAFLIISSIYRIKRLKKTKTKKKEHRKIYVAPIYPIMFGLYLVIAIISVIEYFICNRKINLLVSGLGFLMYTSSIPIRVWATDSLGEYMSEHIEIKEDHKLIKEGPYRYLRHPLLLCLLIEIIGITLIPNSYYSFIAVFMIYFPIIILRMQLEEKALIQKFGQEYIDYKNEVYGLLPLKKKGL